VGEAMQARARVPGAASALLRFRGIEVPMLLLPDGSFWAVVGAPLDQVPGPVTLSIAGRSPAGTVLGTSTQQVSVVPVTRPVDYLEASEATTAVLTADAQVRNDTIRAQQFATFDPTPVWKGLFIRPVAGEITTQFGQGRSINGGPVGGFHGGTDLAEPEGTPVKAAAPGRVCWTGAMPIHGNSLLIDHGGGVKSGYHHLSRIVGQAGDTVEAGKTIGLVGSTGFSTGPHLHWEVTVWGVNVDAMTWLTVPFGPTA
jgi:murein DD-endopeptidase MepM/ murein hydrolase activator NlpD